MEHEERSDALANLKAIGFPRPIGRGSIEAEWHKMTTIEETLYQTKNRSRQDPLNFPIPLNDKLASVAESVATGDYAPTAQAQTVYRELVAKIDAQLRALDDVWQKDLPALNQLVQQQQQVPAVKLPEKSDRVSRACGTKHAVRGGQRPDSLRSPALGMTQRSNRAAKARHPR